jgi:hypothetical protein
MEKIQIDWCNWLVACSNAGMTKVWEQKWSVIDNSQAFFFPTKSKAT